MEPFVSIVVPVYNAQDFLERCISSVLAQEYTNLELILIDDGSTDDSGAICDTFAAQDPRIRVIHKENTGVSDSRNQALDQARGEYLQFLDSDDWLAPDATRQFVRSAESSRSDMVIADFYRVIGDTISHKGDIEKEELLTREEFAGHMMENPADFYYGVLWNKLYRRDIIEKNRLRMDANISWCEDFIFNLEYLRHCHTIYALQAPVYYYVKTKGSLVNSQGASINNTIRMKLNVFEYYQQFYREVYDEKSYEEIRFQVYRFLLTYAKDGFVPPAFMPGSRKLGQERLTTVLPEALEGDSIAFDYYRYRKMWQRYCEVTAVKNDMTLDEVQVLVYLNQGLMIHDLKQLADLTGISVRKLGSVVQKLEKRQMVRQVNVRKEALAARKERQSAKGEIHSGSKEYSSEQGHAGSEEYLSEQRHSGSKGHLLEQGEAYLAGREHLLEQGEAYLAGREQPLEQKKGRLPRRYYELLPEAAPVLHDLEWAEMDFGEVWLRKLSEKEKGSYRKLSQKVRESVTDFLRG